MAIHTTTWRPDTCGCEIDYEWDDAVVPEARIHTVKNVNIACNVHPVVDSKTHFATIVDENTRKNKIHSLILENLSDLVEEITNAKGQKVKQLKAGTEYKWSFDANRVLQAEITGGNQTHKESLQKLADSSFGPGKVKVI